MSFEDLTKRQRKRASAGFSESPTPERESASVSADLMSLLVPVLTTGVGAILGGTEGVAIGANIGLKAAKQLGEQKVARAEQALEERKLNDAKAERQNVFEHAELMQEDRQKFAESTATTAFERQTKIEEIKSRAGLAKGALKGTAAEQKRLDEGRKEIRNRFVKDPITTNTKLMMQMIKRIEINVGDFSPAGDFALIFNWMKLLDQGSVVRESEFKQAKRIGSIKARAEQKLAEISGAGGLSESQRNDFIVRSQKIMAAQVQLQAGINKASIDEATARGIDPRFVIDNFMTDIKADLKSKARDKFKDMSSADKRTRAKELREKLKRAAGK